MTRFIIRRLGFSLTILVVSSMLIFVGMRVIPGDPTTSLYGPQGAGGLTVEQQREIRQRLGLDQPIPVQYLKWLGAAARGDFGESYFSGFSTWELIQRRLAATAELAIAGLLLGLLIAIPAGILSALRPHSWIDRAVAVVASVGIAIPTFWLGIMLASIFGVQLGVLPALGYEPLVDAPGDNLRHLVLPAATLAILVAAPIMRYLRMSLLEVLSTDYVRTAQGKGLPWRAVVLRHAVPNALLPTVNVVGLVIGYLLAGVVYIEYVFGWPGLGALTVDTVQKRDYLLLQGLVLLTIVMFILTTLVIDLIVLLLDPRLRRGAALSWRSR